MAEIIRLSPYTPRKSGGPTTAYGAVYQRIRATVGMLPGRSVSDTLWHDVISTAHTLTDQPIIVINNVPYQDPTLLPPITEADFHEAFAFAHFVGLPVADFAKQYRVPTKNVQQWIIGEATLIEEARAEWISHAARRLWELEHPRHPPIHYLQRAFAPKN